MGRFTANEFAERKKFRNFISQFRTCSILRNFAEEILIMQRCDWSVSQCLHTSNEASTMLAFESLFPMWKCLLLKEKFRNLYFEIEFQNKYLMWKGPYSIPCPCWCRPIADYTQSHHWCESKRRRSSKVSKLFSPALELYKCTISPRPDQVKWMYIIPPKAAISLISITYS